MSNIWELRILNSDEFGLKGSKLKSYKCAHCGNSFDYYSGQILYKDGKNVFCSYNCRSKFRKENRGNEFLR